MVIEGFWATMADANALMQPCAVQRKRKTYRHLCGGISYAAHFKDANDLLFLCCCGKFSGALIPRNWFHLFLKKLILIQQFFPLLLVDLS